MQQNEQREQGLSQGNDERRALPILLTATAAVILVAALRSAGDLLVPILMGLFLATVSYPLMNAMVLRKVPQVLAVFLTVMLNIAVFAGLIFFSKGLVEVVRGDTELRTVVERILELTRSAAQKLEQTGVKGATEALNGFINDGDVVKTLVGGTGQLVERFFGPLVGQVTSLASSAGIALIVMVFSLIEGRRLGQKIAQILEVNGPDFTRFQGAAQDIQRYLRIKTGASLVTGVLAWLVCSFAGIDNAALWGILAFILNFIPIVGSIIASVPPFAIALANFGFWRAAMVLLAYVGINFAVGNFLEPSLLGKRFGLSTLIVVVAVFFWGWMWGPLGMFLAVPLTMLFKVAFDNSKDFAWVSVAMGKGKEGAGDQTS